MDTRTRILALRAMERIKANPNYCKRIGISSRLTNKQSKKKDGL